MKYVVEVRSILHFEDRSTELFVLIWRFFPAPWIQSLQLKQMKAMEEELDMYRQQVDLFKSDIEAANEAMRTLCHKWVMDQRRGRSFPQEASDGAENINGASGEWNSPVPSAAPIVDGQTPAPFEGSIASNNIRDE